MGNQHAKEEDQPTIARSQSFELISSADIQDHDVRELSEAKMTSGDGKKAKKRKADKKPNKRRSKDDMDLKTANSLDDDIVVDIPKKKKDMEDLITKQAIEIRSQRQMICHGKKYCEKLLDDIENSFRRLEERDQALSDKESIIQSYSMKNQNLKATVERIQSELSEKEKLLSRKQKEVLSFEKQLREANKTMEGLQTELEDKTARKSNGIRLSSEGSFKESSLTKANERLKLQLVDKETLIAEGREVLQGLKAEKEQLQRELREVNRNSMDKQLTIDRLTRERERDKVRIDQKETEANGKSKALEKTESDLRQCREELRNKERELERKNKILNQESEAKRNLEQELRNRDNTLSTKERESERNKRLLDKISEDKRIIEQRLEAERRATQETISTLQEEKRVSNENLRRLQASQQVQERALQNVEADRNRAKQSADILRKDQPWMIAKDEIILSDRVLGTGAWGRVFEGTFRGTKVAVKELHEIIQSAHNKVLFEREITFVTLVRHPCILQFLGVAGYRSTSPLLVTELMDMSLADLLSRERVLTRSCVIRLGKDAAYGLNYLHCFRPRPIAHRDINPGNIMVWKHGDVWRGKLCDFGSADFLSDNMSVNPGNPFYSAPEVESSKQTDKVDVFSYGVLLCELITSKSPDPANRTRQISQVWNESLKSLIRDCVNENPDGRPSMSRVIEILTSL